MPVVLTEQISEDEILGIWHITESYEELENRLRKTPWIDNEQDGTTHPIKKLEYLACRFATEHLADSIGVPFHGVYKDSHGKPHPKGDDFYISWSHAYPYAVSCLHLKKPVGIDIERPREQLVRVSGKYMNEKENWLKQENDMNQLCLVWAAKEAIFKMNGRSGLSLKDDITVIKIDYTGKKILASANINGSIMKIFLNFFSTAENWIVYTR